MANTPSTVSKLRQVLKLHDQGVLKLQISTITGLSRNTVREHLTLFAELETAWDSLSRLSDKELHEFFRLEPIVQLDDRAQKLNEFLKENDKKLSQRGMTLGRLYTQYACDVTDGYHTTAFYKHYRLLKHRAAPNMLRVHIAGDKMYVDYTGVKLQAVDVSTSEVADTEVFVAILGASQMTYVDAMASQKVEDFIAYCERAFHFYGGAPLAVVTDNLKSAVIKSNRNEPQFNRNFECFADHYDMIKLSQQLLIVDDFGMEPLESMSRAILMEGIEDRPRETLYTLQLSGARVQLVQSARRTNHCGCYFRPHHSRRI